MILLAGQVISSKVFVPAEVLSNHKYAWDPSGGAYETNAPTEEPIDVSDRIIDGLPIPCAAIHSTATVTGLRSEAIGPQIFSPRIRADEHKAYAVVVVAAIQRRSKKSLCCTEFLVSAAELSNRYLESRRLVGMKDGGFSFLRRPRELKPGARKKDLL